VTKCLTETPEWVEMGGGQTGPWTLDDIYSRVTLGRTGKVWPVSNGRTGFEQKYKRK